MIKPLHQSRAFTLVELLVVVAVIGVLIAMILPAIGRARRVTMQTICLSNLRELGTINHSYATDNGDRFIYRTAGWPNMVSATGVGNAFDIRTTLVYYGKTTRIFYCPADVLNIPPSTNTFFLSGVGNAAWGDSYAISYPLWVGLPNTVRYPTNLFITYTYPPPTMPALFPAVYRRAAINPTTVMSSDITSSSPNYTPVPAVASKPTPHPTWTSHVYDGLVEGGSNLLCDGSARWTRADRLTAQIIRYNNPDATYHLYCFW